MMRLQKYLAQCGVASRRAAEQLIESGQVQVNGHCAEVGMSVNPEQDTVTVQGRRVRREEALVYALLHKPIGVVTSAHDNFGRKTVLHLIKGIPERIYPVGRLDMDVSGLLLLTNDGELAFRLMHPRYEVKKVYEAWVRGHVGDDAARRLARGVMLEDGPTAPATVELLGYGESSTQIRLTIHEGRNREVKRMCMAVGHPVRRLMRVAFAGLDGRGLNPGQWRLLTDAEIAQLKSIVHMA